MIAAGGTTDTMRHLSALGNGPALVVFLWLAAAAQPVEQRWLEAMTDLSDKTVSRALQKLSELQYAAEADGGWMVAAGRQGILGDVLAALPAGPSLVTGPVVNSPIEPAPSQASQAWTDHAQSPVGDFPTRSYGGGVNESLDSLESIKHHHHQKPGDGISDSLRLPADEASRAAALLARLGCWPNQVPALVAALHPVRGLGDVLGWIAYTRWPDNEIRRPPAAVATHLRAGQAPGSQWTPLPVCAHCQRIEPRCTCDSPALEYPPGFDELAFAEPPTWNPEEWLRSRWHCPACGGHPCQCETEYANEEE